MNCHEEHDIIPKHELDKKHNQTQQHETTHNHSDPLKNILFLCQNFLTVQFLSYFFALQ
jgi:hypothetical protein